MNSTWTALFCLPQSTNLSQLDVCGAKIKVFLMLSLIQWQYSHLLNLLYHCYHFFCLLVFTNCSMLLASPIEFQKTRKLVQFLRTRVHAPMMGFKMQVDARLILKIPFATMAFKIKLEKQPTTSNKFFKLLEKSDDWNQT